MKYKYPYAEQFNRIEKLRKRLNIYSEITDENFENARDDFSSFFIQCYHLSDWLIKSGFNEKSVHQYVKRKNCLALCKDLANTQKHQKIDRYKPPHSFVNFGFGVTTPMTRFVDHFGDGKVKLGIDVWEHGTSTEALKVADQCIKDWTDYIEMENQIGF